METCKINSCIYKVRHYFDRGILSYPDQNKFDLCIYFSGCIPANSVLEVYNELSELISSSSIYDLESALNSMFREYLDLNVMGDNYCNVKCIELVKDTGAIKLKVYLVTKE